MSEENGPVVELHVVSDSTGETATRVVAAVEAQFPHQAFAIVRHPRVETVADCRLVLERLKGKPVVVIYTLVEPTLRAAMQELCREADVDAYNLLAEPLALVAKVTGKAAKMEPRAQPPLDETYFKRIAAIEYAVKADDGLGRALPNADIVLVGVSRTSKTPLSMYLGYLGWKVANVPIVMRIDPPAELFEIDPAKIVGVTIDAHRLAEIRAERIQLMGGDRKYASLTAIYDELEYAAGIHRRLGCPVIDVSELSIEEIAQRILRTVARRSGAGAAAG
ncbi:MAG TPA: pyruvate, water dikinase regulatory protein [Gaiellaceae bacterium]